jgi:zinc protease
MKLPLNTLPGPDDITRRELPNGIVILVRENHYAPSVVIAGSVEAGGLFEPVELNGLASFTASMLMRGTQNRDFATIYELLEGNGASLSIGSGHHTAGFSGKSLAEDLPMLLDLLADALRRPVFPPDYVERLRGQTITGLKVHEQDTRYTAGRLFREMVYPPEHPYHRSTDGTIDTVSSITRDQLMAFHQRYYGPCGMVMALVGAIQTDDAIRLVEHYFGDWVLLGQPEPPELPAVPPIAVLHQQTQTMPGKSQNDLVLGGPGPTRFAEDWQAANLANSILGVFGMYGRIGAVVREQNGMAYYSFSRLDGGLGPGPWRVVAGVDPANVWRAVDVIRGELRRLVSEPVSADELADNKANFIGRLPLQLESNEGVAGSILSMERYQLGLDYLRRYADLVNAVTVEEVLAAAQHYLNPDVYALAIAGPELPVAPLDGQGI